MSTPRIRPAEPGIFAPRYRWTTIGSNALIFLAAFEALAVTTVMPVVARELDGGALYSAAFSATLAASVIGMVAGGAASDRRGPTAPLLASVGVFVVGLLACGFAPTMPIFVAGRFLQGLGAGAMNVAIYVIVARVFPAAIHPQIFAAFAAAWVIPSLVGPPVAGAVAVTAGWQLVFLGVSGLVVIAAAAMAPALRDLARGGVRADADPGRSDEDVGRVDAVEDTRSRRRVARDLSLSTLVAAAVLVISVAGDTDDRLGWGLAAAGFAVTVLAVRPLLPAGTLRVARGLPATVLLRGAVAAAFFSAEIYLPYRLQERGGLEPWSAGLILTVGALSWAVGSAVQGRLSERMSHDRAVRIGAVLVALGLAVQVPAALLGPSVVVPAAVGWAAAGAGMGVVFPRMSTLVLAYSGPRDQGANSAALSIADAVGGATAVAITGLIFSAAGGVSGAASFGAALAFSAAVAVAAVPIAIRVRRRSA